MSVFSKGSSADSGTPPLGRLPLAREDVDRGCEVRSKPEYLATLWQNPQTRVVWLYGNQAPLHQGELVLSHPQGSLPDHAVYLGRSQEHGTFSVRSPGAESVELILLTQPGDEPVPALTSPETARGPVIDTSEVAWVSVREVAPALGDRDAGIFVEAIAVANWHQRTKFCSHCGAPLKNSHSGWVKVCSAEGIEHFPRTDPAIIVAIVDDQERILLGSNAAWAENRYSTLAGFVEPGESLEAAVKRESFEEARVIVDSPRYMGSQPWPFPQSLMLGFMARGLNPSEVGVGDDELRAVDWFTRQQIFDKVMAGEMILPGSSSIARHLLAHWYGGPLPEPTTLEN